MQIQAKRKSVCEFYARELQDWAKANAVGLPHTPSHCDQSYHMFYLLLPSNALREGLRQHLKANRIMATSHYEPLHTSEMGEKFGYSAKDLPVTTDLAARILRLPLFNTITQEEQANVAAAVKAFKCT